jgi:membrane protease YdiL (CAAX protease family)
LNLRSFFIAHDGRPQPPWRILLFLTLGAACILVVTVALGPVLQRLEDIVGIGGTAAAYATTIALLLAHWMTLRTYDQRPYVFVGLQAEAARPPVLLRGWLLGALPIAFASFLLLAPGWLDVVPSEPGSWWRAALQVSLLLLPAALYEELLARGYIFATLSEWLGRPIAVGLTSVAFGLMHVPNPGSNPLPIVVVTLAGVYLATVLLATRSLYAAWMAHWAWNWVMAVGFHVPVSGLSLARPDYQTVDAGPDWLTGGTWGPEGGAVAGVGMIGGLVYLYWRRKPRADGREPSTIHTNDDIEG